MKRAAPKPAAKIVQITQVEGSATELRAFVGLDADGVLWGFKRIARHDSGFDASYWVARVLCDQRKVKR